MRYVLSETFCGEVFLKYMDQQTLVKRRWSYKVRITEYIQQQQQQQQHFIAPHNIQEIKIYNNSTYDDRGAGSP